MLSATSRQNGQQLFGTICLRKARLLY